MIVVTWRGREHITACLDALAAQGRAHRTIVVDNASTDGTAELIAAHPSAPRVLRLPRNAGYAGGLAAALPLVDTPFVGWLNDDAAPEPDWLAALEDAVDGSATVAAATSSMLLGDGSTQSVGVRLTGDGHGADLTLAGRDVFGFCGGAALLRTDALARVGGVPADFFCYYEDTDTAWRLRLAGWRVVSVGPARVRHRHGASTEPGSARFHRWNERNRLLTLARCAPAGVALRQAAAFAAITAALPLRRLRGVAVPDAANFRLRLRLLVLAELLLRLPGCLAARRRIGRSATVPRAAVWREWAGR
ncbi:glycosyltransferase [Solihabitans fulvus]|uniref:Glycosyltransferase n=1 Tax=Solihabitans fulvus TaxID=1892852 RepID=A0A5B2XD14_9PSEU|nr:glycosyltransferase [Solihabitans fulvus]